jgi:hypothetical protein
LIAACLDPQRILVASTSRRSLRSGAIAIEGAGMTRQTRVHERWAHLRFSVVGQLLAAPPGKGELKA